MIWKMDVTQHNVGKHSRLNIPNFLQGWKFIGAWRWSYDCTSRSSRDGERDGISSLQSNTGTLRGSISSKHRPRMYDTIVLLSIITGRNEVVAKVMFLHVCVILFTGGVSRQGEPPPPRAGRTPPPSEKPPRQGEPPRAGRHPPGQGDTPLGRETPPPSRHPPGPNPPQDHPPGQGDPPEQTPPHVTRPPLPGPDRPPEADSSIQSTSGRYASYWNAFSFGYYYPLLVH